MVNGLPVVADKALLTGLLKQELQFQGMVVANMAAVAALHKHARIAPSIKAALTMAINAGVDMLAIPDKASVCADLVALVNDPEIPIWRVDDAVRRIFKVKARAGLFEKFQKTRTALDAHATAYEAAVESITLLKNSGNILPLAPGTRLLVSGRNANSARALGCNLSECGTIFEAIQAVNGRDITFYEPGANAVDRALAKAAAVDVVMVVVGEDAYSRDDGPLPDVALPNEQVELVKALIGTGKPVVLIINSGRPRVLGGVVQKVAAALNVYMPGTFGGIALADVLFGKVNPSGKLPFTYPKYRNTLIPYWHKWSEEATKQPRAADNPTSFRPEFEFGFGLSYTTFQYLRLSLSQPSFKDGEELRVSVTVANTGTRLGKEVVMLYTSDVTTPLTPDVKRLRRFKKIELDVGESRTVRFDLGAEDFSFVNADGMRVTEKGEFRIAVGGLNSTVYFV
jgi:beta-glucosidase